MQQNYLKVIGRGNAIEKHYKKSGELLKISSKTRLAHVRRIPGHEFLRRTRARRNLQPNIIGTFLSTYNTVSNTVPLLVRRCVPLHPLIRAARQQCPTTYRDDATKTPHRVPTGRQVARPYTTIPLHTLSVARSHRGSGLIPYLRRTSQVPS